jgi:hypothetical protein
MSYNEHNFLIIETQDKIEIQNKISKQKREKK